MPITINDCGKCGKIATVIPATVGWSIQIGCISCINEGKAKWFYVVVDDDFVKKVAEWNAANNYYPTCESANPCRKCGKKPRVEYRVRHGVDLWGAECIDEYCCNYRYCGTKEAVIDAWNALNPRRNNANNNE